MEKYRGQESANRKASLENISNKLSGLSMHGVKKKYSRLTHKLMVEKMGIGFAVSIITTKNYFTLILCRIFHFRVEMLNLKSWKKKSKVFHHQAKI